MRILLLTHYFAPEGNAPASRALEMCRRWAAAGHDVHVITCVPNVPDGVVYDGYRNRLIQHERIDGIDVTRVWTYLAANRGTGRRIANYLSYMVSATVASLGAKRPDVVIATSPQLFCGWAGVLLGKLRRVPLVLEIRDLWPETIVAVGAITSRPAIRLLEALERGMYAGATHVVTVGEGYRRQLLARGVPAERISVVPNGVDGEAFAPAAPNPALRRRLGLDGCFVCSTVGTIGLCGGLEVVLHAARRLKRAGAYHFRLLLVGDGARREALQQEARDEGLDNIIFTGRVAKEQVREYLALSDACLVHLRQHDLFRTVYPSKLFEAAAMEKPIILGVAGSAAELVRQARAGVCIEPENAEHLCQALFTLAENPDVAQRMGRNGRAFVLEHFNRDQLAEEYLEILQSVVSQSAGASFRPDRQRRRPAQAAGGVRPRPAWRTPTAKEKAQTCESWS